MSVISESLSGYVRGTCQWVVGFQEPSPQCSLRWKHREAGAPSRAEVLEAAPLGSERLLLPWLHPLGLQCLGHRRKALS